MELLTTIAAAATSTPAATLALGGTAISTVGQLQAGAAEQQAANFQAAQLTQQAQAERASSQAEAQEERRQKELRISRARAVAAASGGGQDFDLLGDLEEDGELRALTALWEGEERARGRKLQAASARQTGRNRKRASIFKTGSTLLQGGASFLDNYG